MSIVSQLSVSLAACKRRYGGSQPLVRLERLQKAL